MLAIGEGAPGQEILGAIRHVRNHFEQHDGFVEMIEIVGCDAGAGIDVGRAQLGGSGLCVRARFARRAAMRSRRWWGIGGHRLQCWGWGLKGAERMPISYDQCADALSSPRLRMPCGRFLATPSSRISRRGTISRRRSPCLSLSLSMAPGIFGWCAGD